MQFVELPRPTPQRHGHRQTSCSPAPDAAPFALNVMCTLVVTAHPEATQRPPASDRSDLLRRPGFASVVRGHPISSSAKISSPVPITPGGRVHRGGLTVYASSCPLFLSSSVLSRPPILSPHAEVHLCPLLSSQQLTLPLPVGLSSFPPSGRCLPAWPTCRALAS